jgi:large subunit ribosomal protein L15
MQIHDLRPNPGSRRPRKRVGRGESSGHGKTSTRGNKGRKSRGTVPLGFEGGQTPLHRRLPLRRGFRNLHGTVYSIINIGQLANLEAGDLVTPELLLESGLVRKLRDGIKVLGAGEIKQPLTIRAHRSSDSAREKILAAGGSAEVI